MSFIVVQNATEWNHYCRFDLKIIVHKIYCYSLFFRFHYAYYNKFIYIIVFRMNNIRSVSYTLFRWLLSSLANRLRRGVFTFTVI